MLTPGGDEVPAKRVGNTFGIVAKVMEGVVCGVSETTKGRDEKEEMEPEVPVHDPRARSSPEERAAEGPEILDVPVPLSIGSRVKDMKERLRELSESTHGTKDVLWSRLQKCERILKEKMEMQNTIRMRQQARIEGTDVEDASTVPIPDTPSEFVRQQHELTHTPAVPWCEACVLGQAGEHPHSLVPFEKKQGLPIVVFDYAFNFGVGADEKLFGTSLIIADMVTGFVKACGASSKKAGEYMVGQVVDFCSQLGYGAVELRCDGELATIALQHKVQDIRLQKGFRTVLSTGKLRDSASMGCAEAAVRWWRAKLKTLKYHVQEKYAIEVDRSFEIWSWLCRHAAWLTSRYKLRADGLTSHFAAFGASYTGDVVPFSETVLAKLPLSSGSKQTIGNKRIPKHMTSWVKGIWVGKSDSNDDHIILTKDGVVRARTIRRLVSSSSYDKDVFKAAIGQPFDALCIPQWLREPKPVAIPSLRAEDEALPDLVNETPVPEHEAVEEVRPVAGRTETGLLSEEVLDEEIPPPTEVVYTEDEVIPMATMEKRVADDQSPDAQEAKRLRRLGQGEGESNKQLRVESVMIESEATSDQIVCAVSSMRPHELDLHCVLDYSALAGMEDIDVWNQSSFNNEDVRAAKIKGLNLLREFDVYDVVPESQAEGKKHITTKWETAARRGKIKCRMVAREFKWLEERDDGFAPAFGTHKQGH
eukprot:2063755-Amphidinium_carterae.2